MLLYLVALALAAPTVQELFPASRAPEAAVHDRLPALLGAPAQVYDTVTATPGEASVFEAGLERALFPKLRPAPDSLRRFGEIYLGLADLGRLPYPVETFLAEHVGLPTGPVLMGNFLSDGTDAKAMAELLRDYSEAEGLVTAAVVTAPIKGGVRGVVVGLTDVIAFERFPRVWRLGDAPTLPGVLLSRGKRYSLYVADETPVVRELALPAKDGVFELTIPVPEAGGALRVAMSEQGRRGLPDTNFYFSLYVGVAPPTVPERLPSPPAEADPEQALLEGMVAERSALKLSTMERAGDTVAAKAWLEGLPEREMAQARAFKALGNRDMLPERPHGRWSGMVVTTDTVAEAIWALRTHPYYRGGLLDAASRFAVIASMPDPAGTRWLVLFYEDVPSVAELRASFRETLGGRFAKPPGAGTALTAELDEIAARVATGDASLNAAMRELQRLVQARMKDGTIEGSASMNLFTWVPGTEADLATYFPGPTMKAAAVGIARGNLGKGSAQMGVAVIVTAEGIEETP